MSAIRTLLRCPGCEAPPAAGDPLACATCGARFEMVDGILDFLIATSARAGGARAHDIEQRVDAFYERHPFPGYAPADDATALLERCGATPFLAALDSSLPADATVLDAGCGTGQIAAFLALSGTARTVVGVDRCRASLAAAAGFAARARLANLHLLRASLFALPLAPAAFDVVVSRGVVHHTPDPHGAIASVARRVADGGVLVLGVYESAARLVHRARRRLHGVWPGAVRRLDPVLRRHDLADEKKAIWIADQYEHPLERVLALPDVLATLDRLGFTWVRTLPPAAERGALMRTTPRPSPLGLAARRAGWALSGLRDPDAGLVCVVARRG